MLFSKNKYTSLHPKTGEKEIESYMDIWVDELKEVEFQINKVRSSPLHVTLPARNEALLFGSIT